MRTISRQASTMDLIRFYIKPVSNEEAASLDFQDMVLDVELELIRRDDVPEEYHDLIDDIQEDLL